MTNADPKTAKLSFAGLAEFLGLKKSILGLLAMVILVGIGEKMSERFLPIYLLALGAGPIIVGFLNGLDNALSALYSFPGGYLSDRIGTKRALLVFNIIAMFGFLFVIFIPRWWAVIIGSIFFLSWTSLSLPATMSLVALVLPKNKRTMGVSMHSLIRRIPMAAGPVLGGLFIDIWGTVTGVRLAFVAALVMAALAAVMQQILIEDDRNKKIDKPRAEKNPFRMLAKMNPQLRQLLVSDILIRFCEQIPYAFIAIWCMKTITSPVSGFQFGILTTVEMITAVLVYIPVAYFADKSHKKPFILMTFVFFTLFPLALLFCKSFWLLVPAFIQRGLKEFGEPTRKALIMDLAPEGQKAAMFGTYYLFRDILVSISAFASGFIWYKLGATGNFLIAFAFGLAGTIWFAAAKYERNKGV
jgi:MFS family permease